MKKTFLILLVLFSLLTSCTKDDSEDKKKDLYTKLLLYFGTIQSSGDSYSKLFYMNPLFLSSSNRNYNLLTPATATSTDSTKKKIVFVHGWNFKDRDSFPNPSDQQLKERIAETIWKEMLNTEFCGSLASKGYEIYFYTYLTSNKISSNSTRFRKALDSAFSGQSKTVTIYSHSMGGLVSKAAINEGEVKEKAIKKPPKFLPEAF